MLASSGLSNWISTPPPYWIQAGWRYYTDDTKPMRYYEYKSPNGDYDLVEIGSQDWGTSVEYRILGAQNGYWYVYIAGEFIDSFYITQIPSTIEVFLEIHDDPNNELWTYFQNAYYWKSNGDFELFNQDHYHADYPYEIEIDHGYDSFITKRMDTYDVFCPLIIKF